LRWRNETQAPLTTEVLEAAFRALDARLVRPATLIVGGGTAMMLAHGLPARTADVVAYPARGRLDDIASQLRAVARELGLAPDWVNPHYETLAHVLPADYGKRLREVFAGAR
jgi:hypothetical protein